MAQSPMGRRPLVAHDVLHDVLDLTDVRSGAWSPSKVRSGEWSPSKPSDEWCLMSARNFVEDAKWENASQARSEKAERRRQKFEESQTSLRCRCASAESVRLQRQEVISSKARDLADRIETVRLHAIRESRARGSARPSRASSSRPISTLAGGHHARRTFRARADRLARVPRR